MYKAARDYVGPVRCAVGSGRFFLLIRNIYSMTSWYIRNLIKFRISLVEGERFAVEGKE